MKGANQEKLRKLIFDEQVSCMHGSTFSQLISFGHRLFKRKLVALTLIDDSEIWLRYTAGVEACRVPIELGLCGSAVLQEELYVVENALMDKLSKENSLVKGDFGIRFYAGKQLKVYGIPIGTICVADTVAGQLSQNEAMLLKSFSSLIESLITTGIEIRLKAEEHYKSKGILESAINSASEGVLVVNRNLELSYFNEAATQMNKVINDASLRLGANILSFFKPGAKRKFKGYYDQVLNGDFVKFESFAKHQWWYISLSPIHNDKGEVIGVTHSVSNITAKKDLEIKAQKSSTLLEHIAWVHAHEIRRPAANILGIIPLFDKEVMSDTNTQRLDMLKRSGDELDQSLWRLARVIEQFGSAVSPDKRI